MTYFVGQGGALTIKASEIRSVSITGQTAYSDAARSSSVSFPDVIAADKTYYFAENSPVVVTVKNGVGRTLTSVNLGMKGGARQTITPNESADDLASGGNGLLRSGAIAETVPRWLAATNATVLSTGRMSLVGIHLEAGQVVSNISFMSATTALGTGTHQWFALYSSARALLGQTANDTSTAWGANSVKTLAMATPYTVTASGLYYLGINVTATTVPTLFAYAGNANPIGLTPILTGTSDSSLTSTAPATATAITAAANVPYAYVS